VLNSISFGLQQDYADDGVIDLQWNILGMVFACCFCFELLVRVCTLGTDYFYDAINAIDSFLILGIVFDVFILIPAQAVPIAGMLRMASELRMLRVVTFIKLARHFRSLRELWLLVGGFVNSVKALAWVGVLICILIFPFSVMFTTEIGWNHALYNGTASYDDKAWRYDIYFGSIWKTTFTLVQVLTRDGWCDGIVRHVLHKQPNMWIFFYIFMILSSFGLMNVIVGVIVENTLQAAKVADERVMLYEQWENGKLIDSMVELLTMSDVSRSGCLHFEEFTAAIDGPLLKEKLDAIDISHQEAQEVYVLHRDAHCKVRVY
jgi:voltage-gated sodium channel